MCKNLKHRHQCYAGLLFLTPVFEKLPNSALAAIVVAGLLSIFDVDEAIWLWKASHYISIHNKKIFQTYLVRWPELLLPACSLIFDNDEAI